MTKNRKYIFEIISKFFSNRYDSELEKDIQKWIVDDKFPEEKEAAMHDIWEKLVVEADKSTYISLNKVKGKLGIQQKPVRTTLFSFSRVAAILIPIFFVIGGYYLFLHKGTNIMEITASYGEISERVLPDGTEVWVNSGSSIKYDENFRASERIISLNGEACFDVEKQKSKPFVVKTEYLDIRVLGTQLNIRAYPEEGRSIVTLATGSVSIKTQTGESYEINPNQQLVYNNITSEILIEDVVASDFMGWRAGLLLFNGATFGEIISSIERHYNVSVIVNDSLDTPGDIYTIRFVNQENLDRALMILHELIGGFSYDISDDGTTIYIHEPGIEPAQQEIPETVTNTQPAIEAASENYLVSINSQEVSYKDIFEQIESQTGYTVGFNQSKFDAYRILTGTSYAETYFEEILADILNESGFSYKIEGKHILIVEESGLQTISGYISNFNSGRPISNALLTWGSNKGIRTDLDGHFIIEHLKPGNYTVNINAPGYHSGSRNVSLIERGEGALLRLNLSEVIPVITTKVVGDTIINTNPPSASITQTPGRMERPYFVIKSNLLYMFGAYTPNLAFEFSLNNRFTIDLQVGYNPFTLSEGRRYNHLLIQPELRYWPTLAFNKHFLGLHMVYVNYDIARIGSTYMKSRIYDGTLFGVGISYGYNYRINRKWALEGTIGLGYANMRYDTYRESITDTEIFKESYDYFGITKLGINITYRIK